MYRVQNLSNREIVFQGVKIKPYGFSDYAIITDYIALSRLSNANKIRYNQFVPEKVEAPVEVPVVEEKVEVIEPVAEPVEEPIVEPVAEEPVIEEVPVEEAPVEEAPKKRTRGYKKSADSDEK